MIFEQPNIGFIIDAKEILNCRKLNYFKKCCIRDTPVLETLDQISQKTTLFKLAVPNSSSIKFPEDKAIWDEETKILQQKHDFHTCDVQ